MSTVAGMDMGSSGVKLAMMEGRGGKAHCTGFHVYDAEFEGVLDESEMLQAVRTMLQDAQQIPSAITVGLPTYQITTKVTDYPTVKCHEIKRLVSMEASQISGFSEESFLHGYTPLPSGWERKHPVLVGLAREQDVRGRLKALDDAKLPCGDIQPAGLALVVAAFDLVEKLGDSKAPQLLLDVGKETTTMVVVAAGQVLYLASLMFGADAFATASKSQQKRHPSLVSTPVSEDCLSQMDLMAEGAHSPLTQAALGLEAEIQNGLEHWRSQELPELASAPVECVHVTGGGSRLGGFVEWLSVKLECPVDQFGPQWQNAMHPELTVAYGLGLQAAGRKVYRLSLLPADVSDRQLRLRRWPFLACAALLAVGTCLLWQGMETYTSLERSQALQERKRHLQACVDKAGQLKALAVKAINQENLLLLLARDGQRGRTVSQAMRRMGCINSKEGWIIYLADQRTAYNSGAFFHVEPVSKPELFSSQKSHQRALSVPESAPAESFVCAGYVPKRNTNSIQNLIGQLNEVRSSLFAGVDRGNSIAETAGELVWSWREFLNRDAVRLRKALSIQHKHELSFADCFELFTLKLPLTTTTPTSQTPHSSRR